MVNSLFLATIIRIVLVIISYGSKVPAGIFVPSMAIGATFGRMIGIMVKALYRCVPMLYTPGILLLTEHLRLVHIPHLEYLQSANLMSRVSRLERMRSWAQQRH